MSNKRQAVRNHITAAKTWLSQAENSIDKENDIRSDLDLMLAQAELQRAQETKQRRLWLLWLKRLAPLGAAILVGAAYVLFLRPELAGRQPETPIPAAAETEVPPGDPILAQPIQEQAAPVPEEAGGAAAQPEKGTEHAVQQPTAQGPLEAALTGQPAASAAKPAVPDAELQKLMQHAGKTLRE